MNRLKRIKTILCTLYRYRLAELIASLVRPGWARTFLNMLPQSSKFKHRRLPCACVWRWKAWGRFSSNSDRYCPRAPT